MEVDENSQNFNTRSRQKFRHNYFTVSLFRANRREEVLDRAIYVVYRSATRLLTVVPVLTKHHSMKTLVSRRIAPLDFGTRWTGVATFKIRSLYPRQPLQLAGSVVELQSLYGQRGGNKIILPLLRIEPPTEKARFVLYIANMYLQN